MSKRFDAPLDSIIPPAPNAGPAIEANDETADLSNGQLAVTGHGDVVMGSPIDFERAG